MNNPIGLIFGIVIALILAYVAFKIVVGIVVGILAMIFPVLVLVGAGYVLYLIFGPRSLGGGRRTLP